jgi:cell division septation protein DedD
MDSSLKQRLIGAAVLVALAVIFLPMLLKGPDVKEPDAAQVPLSMPAAPDSGYETRELPLTVPEGTRSPGGVLGMTPAEPEALPPPDAADAPAMATAPEQEGAAPAPAPAPAAPPAVAPALAPAATDAVPATVAAGAFMVNVGTFGNLANANLLAGRLREQQLPVLVDKLSLASGTAMRVRVGPYRDRATAEAARLRAEGVTGSAGKVVATDAASGAAAATPAAKPAATAAASPATAAKPPAASKAEPAAPRPAPSANAGAVGFAVQLSAPSVEADAIALRDKARAAGFSAFVQPVETEGGRRFRVRVGPVADRAAAGALQAAVAGKLGNKGIIVANP